MKVITLMTARVQFGRLYNLRRTCYTIVQPLIGSTTDPPCHTQPFLIPLWYPLDFTLFGLYRLLKKGYPSAHQLSMLSTSLAFKNKARLVWVISGQNNWRAIKWILWDLAVVISHNKCSHVSTLLMVFGVSGSVHTVIFSRWGYFPRKIFRARIVPWDSDYLRLLCGYLRVSKVEGLKCLRSGVVALLTDISESSVKTMASCERRRWK